ncbi:hypothetical protein T4B_6773 [Trichinella pseudospiralis]|uniref:Uncharacterized protein n=1 Tax=Trichinella pseudospiralis TaxID=6337 RepID=A0A0V1GLD8_TRIPS|nr:hypothetical protein T4B_6773 [Trichinella pseudospiralis]
MNRNTHGEERRQVEKATRSERIAWIESFVGHFVRWSAAFVGQIQVTEDWLDGEDTIYRSRVRNKRPMLRYFLAMMIM